MVLPAEADFGNPLEVRDYVRRHATPGDPRRVLDVLDRYAREHRFLMNVGPDKGQILAEVVEGLGEGSLVLELGTYCGYSAILTAIHLAAEGTVVSVDDDPDAVSAAAEIIEIAGLSDRISIVHGPSDRVIPNLSGPFELVFMDHGKDFYLRDLLALEQHGLLAPGSIVVADNVGPLFDATDYLDHVRSSDRYDSTHRPSTVEYTDLPDAAEITIVRPDAAGRKDF